MKMIIHSIVKKALILVLLTVFLRDMMMVMRKVVARSFWH